MRYHVIDKQTEYPVEMNKLAWLRNSDGQLRSGWRIAVFLMLLAMIIVGINVGWRALGMPGQQAGGPWIFLLFAALVAGSVLGAIVLLLRWFERSGPAGIGLPFTTNAVTATVAGTALGAMPILLIVGMAALGGYGTFVPAGASVDSFVVILLPLLLAGFLLAAWEELVLRGYLLRQLALGLNRPAAVVITATLFGLLHSGNPGANWQGLLYTSVGGVLMAWLMVRTGSLWLLIGYHFGWNATASSVFGLELSGFEDEPSLFATTLTGSDWLSGGSYGFEASLPAVIAESIVLGVALLMLGGRRPVFPP